MEHRPQNLGEEELWPEKSVVGEQEELQPGDLEEQEKEGGEEEENLALYCRGKGKNLPGGEGEEAHIRTACQTGWEARLWDLRVRTA